MNNRHNHKFSVNGGEMAVNRNIELFRIVFKNLDHLIYGSIMILLLLVLIGFYIWKIIYKKEYPLKFYMSGMVFVHFMMAVTAALTTFGGIQDNYVFSSDCIWFNLAMSLIYLPLAVIFELIARKNGSKDRTLRKMTKKRKRK